MKRVAYWLLICFSLGASLPAQQNPATGRTLVIIPFENASPTPGLEWLGEAFPVTFRSQLDSPVLYVTTREERLRGRLLLGLGFAGLAAYRVRQSKRLA